MSENNPKTDAELGTNKQFSAPIINAQPNSDLLQKQEAILLQVYDAKSKEEILHLLDEYHAIYKIKNSY